VTSARNMVRNLRDSGALESKPEGRGVRSGLLVFTSALAFGAVMYVGAVFGLPSLLEAMERKPAPMTFAKPAQAAAPTR
jgi:hypothetical protein